MKHILLSAAACLYLAGCASTAGIYGPATGSNLGYSNTQLEQDRFRVSYTSRDAYESKDFALLRAAEIARNEGYSHFKIIGGEAHNNGPNAIGTNIGFGFGSGRGRGGFNRSSVSVNLFDLGRTLQGSKATETIEVILLNSVNENDPAVFSAQEIIQNIAPRNPETSVAQATQ